MTEPNNKKDFSWEKGEVLGDNNSTPVAEVRRHGMAKIVKALHADPKKRKEEREEHLVVQQSKPYKSKTKTPDDEKFIVEEDSSGIADDGDNSAARRLIDAGRKIKGLDRFGKRK